MTKEQITIAITMLTTLICFLPQLITLLFPEADTSELLRIQKLVEQFVLYLIEYFKVLIQ
jgi:hypothetical protein